MIARFSRRHALAWALLGCALGLLQDPAVARNWQAPFYQGHVLTGKIWDTGKSTWISEEQWFAELLQHEYILLGEAHDNPDHHLLQAEVLDRLVEGGEKPAVVMEMLAQGTWRDQPVYWSDVASLQQAAKVRNANWPWELYAPVLHAVVRHGLELIAGNIESEALQVESEKAGADWIRETAARSGIPAHGLQQLEHDIAESHCGYARPGFIRYMAGAQLYRDHVITQALIGSLPPVVLIAGSGHVRTDYAVPMHLRKIYRRASYLSVAMIPVKPEALRPEDYLRGVPDAFDILYFTPSHTEQNPCIQYEKQLQRLRQKGAAK